MSTNLQIKQQQQQKLRKKYNRDALGTLYYLVILVGTVRWRSLMAFLPANLPTALFCLVLHVGLVDHPAVSRVNAVRAVCRHRVGLIFPCVGCIIAVSLCLRGGCGGGCFRWVYSYDHSHICLGFCLTLHTPGRLTPPSVLNIYTDRGCRVSLGHFCRLRGHLASSQGSSESVSRDWQLAGGGGCWWS